MTRPGSEAPPYGGDPLLPPKALQTCPTPGCPTLTRTGRCGDCQRTARARRRPDTAKGYDARWYRTRAAYLREHPLCECEEHSAQPWIIRPRAAEVHHKDGLGPLGPRGFDWSNLQSLTKRCHSRLTAREQPAGWNDRE